MTRCLIVNADDFGQTPGTNRGVVEAHERGIVTSASLMVRWPAAAHAAAYARAHPRLGVGLHLDLGEWIWRDGAWTALYEVPGDPRDELRRQLARFRELVGRDPTHLDSHQHVHLRESLRPLAVELATELGVPLRELTDRARHVGTFYGQEGDGRPHPEGITVEHLVGLIEGLPDGWTELGCHPGLDDDSPSMYRTERATEVAVLCDPRVRQAMDRSAVRLATFAELPPGGL